MSPVEGVDGPKGAHQRVLHQVLGIRTATSEARAAEQARAVVGDVLEFELTPKAGRDRSGSSP